MNRPPPKKPRLLSQRMIADRDQAKLNAGVIEASHRADFFSKCRYEGIVDARVAVVVELRKKGRTMPDISAMIGRWDHSTVRAMLRRAIARGLIDAGCLKQYWRESTGD